MTAGQCCVYLCHVYLPLSCLFTSVMFVCLCGVCLPQPYVLTCTVFIYMYCVCLHVPHLFYFIVFVYLYHVCLPVRCLRTDLGETTLLLHVLHPRICWLSVWEFPQKPFLNFLPGFFSYSSLPKVTPWCTWFTEVSRGQQHQSLIEDAKSTHWCLWVDLKEPQFLVELWGWDQPQLRDAGLFCGECSNVGGGQLRLSVS